MKYFALLLLALPLMGHAAPSSHADHSASTCGPVLQEIKAAAQYVGKGNYGVQLSQGGQTQYILLLQQPATKGEKVRWRLIQRQGKGLTYCILGEGHGATSLGDMHLSNPKGRYGMPGSGYPRCAGKQPSGLPGSLDIRMWANKELGNSLIFNLPNTAGNRNYVVLFSTDAKGEWIILDYNPANVDDSCYYDRGDASTIVPNVNTK